MKRIVILSFLSLLSCKESYTNQSNQQMKTEVPGKVITLDSLESMFTNISKTSKWDMDNAMLWGYFFH
ncbi:hypothetical protein ACFPK9_15810 [Rubritalea spongiae]|uniref:Uncharacterized protein n=1 Tax=Rubritalea spongiae TaxID=430797 RepID=A0ABW5E0H6_9BACT